ncbi:MFS transporter [Oenococcus oeni]|uniref:MFS transporter n=1 Tax=Oenococcus oeni TaxID=1247 RepID=UPI00107D5194|nr:MFS transporter [Oenococcus oeni]AVI93735.1 MFS transporter [Oenococcus oeni]SYW01382.1 MFS transporter [Oenococcus oeni]SYW01951.1 MFS transporter [Oenococcus oeni]SYW02448.1 MFS transporter [Oenococcus oeni]SYW14767.1 MFS transporter [Oenococcus oeni]
MKQKQMAILMTMTIGIFLCMLDTTVMNIALPAIQTGLHTDLDTLQWALNVYTITFAAFTIPLGRIADQFGRNKVYFTGLILFLLGSLTSASSSTVAILIIGRALQSIGAAIVFPASMTIGINSVQLSKRNTAVLILGITQGLAAAFGPTIGGLLTQFCGWRGIFYINVPLVLLAAIMCVVLLPMKNENIVKAKLDISGMCLVILLLFSLTLALVKASAWGWTSGKILSLFAGFVIALILFIWRESMASDPMIRLDLFKYRHFTGAVVMTVLSGILFVGVMVLMPSFFTKIQGHTELEAALMITPASIMVFLLSPVSGLLLKKMGARQLIALGIVLLGLGYVGLSFMNPRIYWQFAISCILIGTGYGIVIGPITVLSAGDFTGELLTASQSVTGVFRQIGTVLAVAIFVSALSTNLTTAKAQIWSAARNEVKKLSVSQTRQKHILKVTHQNLYSTESTTTSNKTAIGAKTQTLIISKETKQYLMKNHSTQWPESAKRRVQTKIAIVVREKVRKINQQVHRYQEFLSQTVKNKMTTAFIKPYQVAMPFAWLLLLATLIFKKRERKDIKHL